MTIQTNEHYKVFWELTTPEKPGKREKPEKSGKSPTLAIATGRCSEGSTGKWLEEYLGFVPGEYAFTVEGIAYVLNPKGGDRIAHTYTETTTLHVGLSQMSTFIAAFLGALFAYLVVALQPGQDFDQWKVKSARATAAVSSLSSGAGGWFGMVRGWLHSLAVILRNAIAAGLLGSALTIVASRLSDTQFPIKVSVNDFWGALTIGFVSYFIGNKLLATIIDKFTPRPKNLPGGSLGGPPPARA